MGFVVAGLGLGFHAVPAPRFSTVSAAVSLVPGRRNVELVANIELFIPIALLVGLRHVDPAACTTR